MKHLKNRFTPSRWVLLGVISLGMTALLVQSSSAVGGITVDQLAGPWQITLIGNTGCGFTSMLVNVTLDSKGTGSATTTYHTGLSPSCHDNTATNLPFTIQSLNPNGSGTAGLSCGPGCGWQFNIQVSPFRSTFNLVDVDPANPNNFLQGSAIRQL